MAAFEVPLDAPVWPFRANWREEPKTDYEYKTTIATSQSGKEQRRALRVQPRFRQQVLASAFSVGDRQKMQRFLFENQSLPVAIPDFTNVQTGEVISASIVRPSQAAKWATVGAAILIEGLTTVQLRHVQAYDAATRNITLSTPTGITGSVRIYPAVYSRFKSSLKGTMHTRKVLEVDVETDGEVGFTNPVYEGAPGTMFDGREVFEFAPDWADHTLAFQNALTVVDYGQGRPFTSNRRQFNTRVYNQRFLLATREERESFAAFFFRMKGRRGEFFAPIGSDDLTVKSHTNTILTCEATGATSFAANRVDRALAVYLADGRKTYQKVTLVQQFNGDLRVTMSPGLPWSIATTDILRVCWMPLCRFGSDKLTIRHASAVASRSEVNIQTLEYRTAE